MPAAIPLPVRLHADAAARALRCAATILDDPTHAAAAAERGALCLPLGDGAPRLALCLERTADAPAWSDDDRALAESLARAAGAAADADARLAELVRHVDEIQAIASLGSFQWFIAEDRIEWSAEQLRIHGRDASTHPRDLAGFLACIHPDDRPGIAAAVGRLVGDGTGEWHYRVVRPDGAVRLVHARNSVVYDAGGAATRVVGTVQDVTRAAGVERELRAANEALEQRVAERTAALARSEEHFRRLIEHAHDLIVIIDDEGRPVYGSPSVKRVLGFDPSEVDAGALAAPYHPDDVPAIEAWVRQLGEQRGATHRIEYRFRHRDGHWLYLEAVSSVPADYRPGTGHVINIRDVTERRRADAALRESEEHFRTLIENAHDIIVIIDGHTGRLVYQSPSMQRILGYAPEELADVNAFSLVHPDDAERVAAEIGHALAHPGVTRHAEYRYRHRDGSWRDLATFGRTLTPGGGDGRLVFNTRDVTARKRADAALRESEARYRTLIEQLPAIIYTASVEEGNPTLFASPQSEQLLGYSEAEWRASPRLWLERIHEDDRSRVEAEWNAAHAAGDRFASEYRLVTRDERVLWFRDEAKVLRDEAGAPLYIQGVMLDVTDRREAERALHESETKYRALIEGAHDMVTVVDGEGIIQFQSPAALRILGYAPEEMVGTSVFAYVHPDDVARGAERFGRIVANPGTTECVQYRFRHRDGSWRHLESFGRTVLPDSASAGVVGIVRDVTDRREAESALQRSEEHFRRLIENGSDLLVISAVDGALTYVSPSAERLLGYTPDEMVGAMPDEMVHPADVPAIMATLQAAGAAPGTIHHVDFRLRHRNGEWRRFESLARTLRPDSAEAGIVCNARDVTEQREAERALQQSEERWRAMIDNAHDVVTILDPEGRMGYQSPALTRVLGYTPEELAGASVFDYMHPDDAPQVAEQLGRVLAEPGSVGHAEYRFRHKDGSWRHLEAFGRTLSPASAAEGVVANVRDVTERKEAERARRQSEEHFRRLIENGSDLLMISAVDGPLTYVSPSSERVLGYTPDEMLRKRPEDLLHPDDVARVMAAMRGIADAPGTVDAVTWRIRHRDGSWRTIDALGRTLVPGSADAGIVINGRDVTEQRAAEEALARSEEHFRALIERSYDLVQVLDAQGQVVYTGPSVQRLLGYTAEEIAGGTLADFMHPDDLPRAAELVASLLASPGTSGSLQYRVRHKDGSWRWLEAWARTLSPTSAAQGIVANARDITDRREAERALQRSEEHFRALIENAYDLTSISTSDGHIAYMSPSVQRVLGYAPDELEGQWAIAYIHPDDVPLVTRELARVVGTPSAVGHAEYRFRHKDGSWRLFEAFARTLARESADDGLVLNIRDVTERRRTEEALRQAKADAEQARADAERANRAKSEFLSRMSHELRTPMNSILGFAQVLEDLELPPEYRAGVRHILNGGRHLLNLINEVLDIARIEADQQPLSLEPVRVASVVREAIDMVRPLALARGVDVVEAAHGVAERYVRADRQRLVQVLLNLLSNAVKYNRPGGEVRVSGDAGADAAGGARVRLCVRDQGAGIAPERREELFVPFSRLGAERSGIEGTGLGLALSQRLARAMGGALFLDRSGPDGSVFCVELPAAANPLAEAPSLLARAERAGGGVHEAMTLLYVEDNLANLSLVETILLPRPEWRVIPALQGRLGIALATEHLPDVVLLDLHLPDMHGSEVLRALRADARTASIPVVVISADATPRSIEALTAQGADAFLTKPLDVRTFLQTVERIAARAPRVE